MTPEQIERSRYPAGRFTFDGDNQESVRYRAIDEIAALPAELRRAISGLALPQLETPYRPGGWTVQQVVHHIPDSHMNAYVRFKLALTEAAPTIKTYEEARWAELPDSRSVDPTVSLALVEALHTRWTALLRAMGADDFQRCYVHPEMGREVSLGEALQMYAWHGKHHVAQIMALREREGWL